ncbi:hypothetical protein [Paenibacillus pini]|uniref:hypothetical protein n=1 Tax=Paenibacillus pini TaxID=669461 RepID=UPI000AEF0F30|nr:hypothetical protein [Paenibacillus pini]
MITSRWESERLLIADLKEDEIDEVQELYKTSSDIELWGREESGKEYIRHCFNEGDLPPMIEKDVSHYFIPKEKGGVIIFLKILMEYRNEQ